MIGLLIQIFVILLVVGLFLWGIAQIPGIPAPIIMVARVIAVIIVCLWLLQASGLIDAGSMTVPHPLRVN